MTNAQRDAVRQWVDANLKACPKCGNENWVVLERLWSVTGLPIGSEVPGSLPTTVSTIVKCDECGVELVEPIKAISLLARTEGRYRGSVHSKPERTDAMFRAIAAAASRGKTVTYQQLETATGLPARFQARQLEYIRDEICRRHGRPWLTVIVVQKWIGEPSSGWFPADLDKPDDLATFRKNMEQKVFDYDWSSVE